MHTYVLRRIVLAVPTLLGGMLVLFLIMRILPGDVALMMLRGGESAETGTFSQEAYMELREAIGLNKPIALQFLEWLGKVFRLDFGVSFISNEPVMKEVLHRLPLTVEITVLATALGLLVGVPLGIIAAYRQDSFYDYGLRAIAALGLAIPHFWLGLMVLLLGIRWFLWSPPIGYHPIWDGWANLRQLIWPAAIIGLGHVSMVSRLTRSTMLDVLREDYMRTARAKGLGERTILVRHALRNAIIPVVTIAGLTLIGGLNGSVIMEQIFTIPGMGMMLIQGVIARDYPVVQGLVLFMLLVVVIGNLLVDLAYGWLDPRISYS